MRIEALTEVFHEARAAAELKALALEGAGGDFSFGASVREHLPDQAAKMLGSFIPAPLGELIGFERRCRPFLEIEMVVPAGAGEVRLRMTGPSGVEELLRLAFRAPNR